MMDNKRTDDDKYGVLLYYKYAKIPDLDDLFTTYNSNCNALSLLGRVRLAPDGVNVTIGGRLSSLNEHIAFMSKNPLFEGTDFKLATCSEPVNDKIAEECGFTTLSIRIVKELVTFSSHPLLKPPEISNAGQHLSAIAFHSLLQNANASETSKKIVLLDARNLYETRIGKFHVPNVETLDPEIRQYSDFPSWLDNHSKKLCGNSILMYCTGGIRCEMASAYIKSKGPGFENVFQLYGGIQRYMEQFPDGGFFKGKNFVFDHRVSVGPPDNVVGNCLICIFPFDDYSSRSRCRYCRMLVLVCHACKGKNLSYVCELCQKYGKLVEPEPESECESQPKAEPALNGSKKLRILCLHGFRQNASGFKGRTASLAKKLKNMVEFFYIDAPHQLPFIYQNKETGEAKFSPNKVCNRKFAWFIDPNSDKNTSLNWETAQAPFDSQQYQKQTAGYDESLTYLKELVTKNGPFDGILGFSQGAAMAACVAAQKLSLKGEIDFRFVILCSGFCVNLVENEKSLINCPSLHIYGSDHGKDTQIAFHASRRLVSLFEEGSSVILEHDYGHIIPTRSPYIDTIKDFLERFL